MQLHKLLTFSVTDSRGVDESLFTFTVIWCKGLKSAGLYKKSFIKVKYREIWFAAFTMLQMSWLCKLHFFVGLSLGLEWINMHRVLSILKSHCISNDPGWSCAETSFLLTFGSYFFLSQFSLWWLLISYYVSSFLIYLSQIRFFSLLLLLLLSWLQNKKNKGATHVQLNFYFQ